MFLKETKDKNSYLTNIGFIRAITINYIYLIFIAYKCTNLCN